MTSDRQIERTPAGQLGERRTIAIRRRSASRPGRTTSEDRRTGVRCHERERVDAPDREEPSPGNDLERVTDEQQHSDGHEKAGPTVRKRYRGAGEETRSEKRNRECEQSRAGSHGRCAADQKNAPPLTEWTPAKG